MIAYGRQSIDSEDIVAVADVLSGNYLTTGPKVGEFEQALAEKCGVKYAVALSNGTAALHIGAKTILNSGDKVLTTPISFVATSNSILYADATPIFVDVDDGANIDLNLCEDALKKDGSIKAIFAVDFTGRCVDPDGLRFLKDRYGVKILEDAAHSLGSTHLAKGSDLATLSFHPVKHITTGEGGAILTNDEEIYKRSKLLRGHGITREPSEFVLSEEAFGEDGLPPIVLYHYTETRARYNAVDFLDGFSDGYLETDGYQGYNNLPGIRRCSCWAHTRRYFIDAVPKGKQYDYSNPAVQGVQFCSKLFEYERRSQNKKHTFEQRKAYRLEKEKPILDAFWSWLDEQKPRKGSRFETAVKYAQNRKDTLMTYLEDGHCSFSNNLSENVIRPFTVGRKNWLFSATPKGATASALVYTMVEMAKTNELNIYKYLTYLLEHRPSEDMSDEQLEALTPWSKEVQNVCKN